MNLSVALCVLMVAVCSAKPSNVRLAIGDDPNNDGNSIADVFGLMSPSEKYVLSHKHHNEISDISSEGYPASTRRKRAVSLVKAAVRTLLKGSTYAATAVDELGRMQLYIKPGGYERAVKDFYAVRPVKVTKPTPAVINGLVGGRLISLVNEFPNPPYIVFDIDGLKLKTIRYTP